MIVASGDLFAFILIFIQGMALWLSRPFSTFRLRIPILICSAVASVSIVAAILSNSAQLSYALDDFALALCVCIVAFPRYRRAVALARVRANPGGLRLEPPFHGRWRVAAAGPDPLLNHHVVASDQFYACDFVHVTNSFGQAVLAPADGRVERTHDGVADRGGLRPPEGTARADWPFGNYIVLRVEGTFILLCHLRSGSINVRRGERVMAGQQIAECGNSGRSTGPHLHVHAQTTPAANPFKAKGVPIAVRLPNGSYRELVTGDWIVGDAAAKGAVDE
jgi:hypothetical protein